MDDDILLKSSLTNVNLTKFVIRLRDHQVSFQSIKKENSGMEDKTKKKAIWAWTMYDWGNSAFATTIMIAVASVYYSSFAASNLDFSIVRNSQKLR